MATGKPKLTGVDMGFLETIKGWVGLSSKVDDVVDTGLTLIEMGASGIDKLFDTSEEQRDDLMKSRRELFAHALEVNRALNNSKTASSKTRRTLAYVITGNVLVVFNWCVGVVSYAYLRGHNTAEAHTFAVKNAQLLVKDICTLDFDYLVSIS